MIYCKIKERKDSYAVYYVGRVVSDMTGEVIFYEDDRKPELLKQAEKYEVWNNLIMRLYGKYKGDFSKGIFKEKIAIEIG